MSVARWEQTLPPRAIPKKFMWQKEHARQLLRDDFMTTFEQRVAKQFSRIEQLEGNFRISAYGVLRKINSTESK